MPRVPIEELTPGMILSRPIVNDNGIALIAERSELTEVLIAKIRDMNISSVFVAGTGRPAGEKELQLRNIEDKFKNAGDDPYMMILKKIFKEHTEGLYK